jgi:hypothetical protein
MMAIGESTTRGPKDFFHFGITFLGIIFLAAGVVIVSTRTVILGLALIALGMAFFLVHSRDEG